MAAGALAGPVLPGVAFVRKRALLGPQFPGDLREAGNPEDPGCCLQVSAGEAYLVYTDRLYSRSDFNNYLAALYKVVGTFLFGAAVSQSLTDLAKYMTGRLRPNFLAVCDPDWSRVNCSAYVQVEVCRGSPANVTESRWAVLGPQMPHPGRRVEVAEGPSGAVYCGVSCQVEKVGRMGRSKAWRYLYLHHTSRELSWGWGIWPWGRAGGVRRGDPPPRNVRPPPSRSALSSHRLYW